MVEYDQPAFHIASKEDNRVFLQSKEVGSTLSRFVFVIQLMIPGPPYISFCMYYTPSDPGAFLNKEKNNNCKDKLDPFTRVAHKFFFEGDDKFRDKRFKLIPIIVDAPWVVRRTVPSTPALLGTKLKQHYFHGHNYMELDIDIGSSPLASRIVRLSLGYSKNLVIDLGFVLQGNDVDELPEILLGACRCENIDLRRRRVISGR